MSHTLFYGPSGCGKTMFADYIGESLKITDKSKPKFIRTTGGGLTSADDVVDLAWIIGDGDVLFIDEIHDFAKKSKLREIMYEMMDKFSIFGTQIKRFTLVGATTDISAIPFEFRERFVLQYQLSLYNDEEIIQMLETRKCPKEISLEIAKRSRGTPRIALNFFKRLIGESENKKEKLSAGMAIEMFNRNGIDQLGLNQMDKKILGIMYQKNAFLRRNAMGIGSLADQLNIKEDHLRQIYEPYLMKLGFIDRTNRGRILTQQGKEYVDGN